MYVDICMDLDSDCDTDTYGYDFYDAFCLRNTSKTINLKTEADSREELLLYCLRIHYRGIE